MDRSYYYKRGKKRDVSKMTQILKLLKEEDKVIEYFGEIAKYILKEPKINKVPIFRTGQALDHTFKKSEILLIVCHMAIFLVPIQDYIKDPEI